MNLQLLRIHFIKQPQYNLSQTYHKLITNLSQTYQKLITKNLKRKKQYFHQYMLLFCFLEEENDVEWLLVQVWRLWGEIKGSLPQVFLEISVHLIPRYIFTCFVCFITCSHMFRVFYNMQSHVSCVL